MRMRALQWLTTYAMLSIGVAACSSPALQRERAPISRLIDSTRVCSIEGDAPPPFSLDTLVHHVIERRRYVRERWNMPRSKAERRRTWDEEFWLLAWQRRITRGGKADDQMRGFPGPDFYWVLYTVKFRDKSSHVRYGFGLIIGNVHPARSLDPADTLKWFHDSFDIGGLKTDTIIPGSPSGGIYNFQRWHLLQVRGRDVRDFLAREFDWTTVPFDFFRSRTCYYLRRQVNDYVAGAVMSNAWRYLFDEEAPKMEIRE